jgi:sulfur relay (sulfurtransferase) complex TusBCD TusD component (DsrE family)
MKFGIVLNTKHPETAWNALRLGNQAIDGGDEVTVFLLGDGVEIQNIQHPSFDVAAALEKFLDTGGNLLACGTCLTVRQQEAGICPVSTMSQLYQMIAGSDKVVSLG